jgi:hypothetical protein
MDRMNRIKSVTTSRFTIVEQKPETIEPPDAKAQSEIKNKINIWV